MKKSELLSISNVFQGISKDKENTNPEFGFFVLSTIRNTSTETEILQDLVKSHREHPSFKKIQEQEEVLKRAYFVTDRNGQIMFGEDGAPQLLDPTSHTLEQVDKIFKEKMDSLNDEIEMVNTLNKELEAYLESEVDELPKFKQISIKKVPAKFLQDVSVMEFLFKYDFIKESFDEAYEFISAQA